MVESKYDSKLFWSKVRSVRKRTQDRTNIGIQTWKDHFEKVLGSTNCLRDRETDEHASNDDTSRIAFIPEIDDPITQSEVRQAIRKLKDGKASGIDEICGEFLKTAEQLVAPFLTKLFNKLYSESYFPIDWTHAVIIPLFKNGNASNPENYRGISLLSMISKVFTGILNTRLYRWAEKEGKICEEQAGFRKRYSTLDHIFSLIAMIRSSINGKGKGKLYVAFIDYMKAFDKVNRESLWHVLQKLQTSTKMINMLKSMYSSVQACVRWGALYSEFFYCPGGLKQGCLLSPLLFSFLISEVAEEVRSKGRHGFQFVPGSREIFLLLFADDIVLISSTPVGLQNQLDNLAAASDRLGLKANLDKTKVMIYRKGGHVSKAERWFYKGEVLEIVNSYKYLGFILTTRLSFVSAFEELTRKAKAKVVEILKTMWRLGGMNTSVFFKLFDAQVKPMLLYTSEIWGVTQFREIESVHLFACKKLLSVNLRTPNAMVYGETGRYPLYIDSTISVVRYWFALQKMDFHRIPRQAFEMYYNLMSADVGGTKLVWNWVAMVNRSLDLHGFSEVWLNRGVGNEKAFLSLYKQRMIDCYKQGWNAKLNGSDRFETYRSFKLVLQLEQYLSQITISKFRIALTRFRLGINDLKVNARYSGTLQNTSCPFCGLLEDEVHFLFYCDTYKNIRGKYIGKHFNLNKYTGNPLKCLLGSDAKHVLRDIAMYVYYAMKYREDLLS